MKNPKDFAPTSHSYNKVIDHSGPSKEMKHNATRPAVVKPTSPTHFAVIPKSSDGHAGLGNKSITMGNPKEPKKWHKRGYSMQSPS